MGLPETPARRGPRLADAKVLSLVGRGKRVLEIGAGSGQLTQALRARDCEVVAVEADPERAKLATEHCGHVVVGDLDDPDLDLDVELGDRWFDAIVAVDVLQHLRRPAPALARLAPLLAPGGYLVASVPNVAHGSIRLAVLAGRVPYRDDGPLDRSALRFFTRSALVATLTAAGFERLHVETVDQPIEEPEVISLLGPSARAFVEALQEDEDARAYELVAVAQPVAAGPRPARPAISDDEARPAPFSPATALFDEPQLLYLDLIKRVLARDGFPQRQAPGRLPVEGLDPQVRETIAAWLDALELDIVHRSPPSEWPVDAETMLTMPRLDSLISCVGTVVRDGVPGDLIETGVWRGGACILMRAVLRAVDDRSRTVWVADSFQGLPQPDPDRYPADAGDLFWTVEALAVSMGDVMANFERYGLLDDQVRFLPGWFAETLPSAPIERLAVLRLDGDMYASTMQALEALYPKLSVGGFAIIDDYGAVPGCRAAVTEYRAAHDIIEPLVQTDYTEVLWRKER